MILYIQEGVTGKKKIIEILKTLCQNHKSTMNLCFIKVEWDIQLKMYYFRLLLLYKSDLRLNPMEEIVIINTFSDRKTLMDTYS